MPDMDSCTNSPSIFSFASVGIRAFLLPPKGCLFNCVETVNGWAQRFCARWTPHDWGRDKEFPEHGRDAHGRQYTGPQCFAEVRCLCVYLLSM